MDRFLLTRRWLLASAVVLMAVLVMVLLGFWQLRRADEVRSDNDRVRSQLARPPAPIEQLLHAGSDPGAATYRRVEVSGRYEQDEEIALDNRSNQGRAGKHLLTPLLSSAGRALIVDRGWIPLDVNPQTAGPPDAEVRVVGVLFPSERQGSFGASIPPDGDVTAVPRVDIVRIAEQLPYPTYPLYMRLQFQVPAQTRGLPIPPGLPEIDDGPHISYAVQWFLFAGVALSVFGALARREALRRARRFPVA